MPSVVMQPHYEQQPISRTYQYRKVMKPMLERKRRARINRCLDELKELMVSALQAEGENVSKLEKADILELTVRHLQNLRGQGQLNVGAEKFKAGFSHCAAEVSQYLAAPMAAPSIDQETGAKLIRHLGSMIRRMEETPAAPLPREPVYSTPPPSPTHTADLPSVWRPW